jgi:hypothetical protein
MVSTLRFFIYLQVFVLGAEDGEMTDDLALWRRQKQLAFEGILALRAGHILATDEYGGRRINNFEAMNLSHK